jgi:hypothetical protein
MRTDEGGNQVPSTLFEYRKLCASIGGEDCEAVAFLDRKIAQNSGKDEEVVVPDSQMRMLLMPRLSQKATAPQNEVLNVETSDEKVSKRVNHLAREMYVAYGISSGGKNFQGSSLPSWEELPEAIRIHWRVTAIRASTLVTDKIRNDLEKHIGLSEPFANDGKAPEPKTAIAFMRILMSPVFPDSSE